MRAASLLLAALSVSVFGCSSGGGAVVSGAGGTIVSGTGGATPGVDAGVAVGVAVDETLCGAVTLPVSRTIPAGKTTAICAGSTLTASAGVTLTVQGRLLVQGTAQSPVKMMGSTGGPTDWAGLVLEAGGNLSATYLEIHGATTALAARPGSSYAIDHVVIDNSSMLLILSSNGTIAHGILHGLGDNQSATPVFISGASPRISDTVMTQALYNGIDYVVVGGGTSAPVFDHVEVADSHCAFHFNDGSGAVISNSNVHHNAYGLMVIGSVNGQVDHNNFEDNSVNIGSCGGGSTVVSNNYFAGVPFGDGSCPDLVVTGVTPSGPYTTGVGPRP